MLPNRWVYYVFREEIKPAWEDIYNQGSGSINITLTDQRLHSETIFFDLLVMIIGADLPYGDKINGVLFSKYKECISIWIGKFDKRDELMKVILKNLNVILTERKIPPLTMEEIKYKSHGDKKH